MTPIDWTDTLSPDRAELFARGYPHLRILSEEHEHNAKAEKHAWRYVDATDPICYHVVWPQKVAYRIVRTCGVTGTLGRRVEELGGDEPVTAEHAQQMLGRPLPLQYPFQLW